MARSAPILTLLLAAATAIGSLSATLSMVGMRPDQAPAGCHENGEKAPAHGPTNYACCFSGHSAAIPRQFLLPVAPVYIAAYRIVTNDFGISSLSNSETFATISSADPPGVLPLRI